MNLQQGDKVYVKDSFAEVGEGANITAEQLENRKSLVHKVGVIESEVFGSHYDMATVRFEGEKEPFAIKVEHLAFISRGDEMFIRTSAIETLLVAADEVLKNKDNELYRVKLRLASDVVKGYMPDAILKALKD